jgi:Ca2+-binding RTX toxin-like protein
MNAFEPLESRQHMDATAPYVINGTPGNDVIVVRPQPPPVLQTLGFGVRNVRANTVLNNATLVTVNGVTTIAQLAPGQRIQINGLDGSDRINVTGSRNVEINAGNGDDVVTGGVGADQILRLAGSDLDRAGAASARE